MKTTILLSPLLLALLAGCSEPANQTPVAELDRATDTGYGVYRDQRFSHRHGDSGRSIRENGEHRAWSAAEISIKVEGDPTT